MRGADVVVAGGGTAGAVVAARLVEAGAAVVLVEAGPDHGAFSGGAWPLELTDAATIPTSHDWGYRSADGGLAFERARVIGGCSAHNGCTASWGHRADYDGWGLPGWSAEDVLPRFEDASRRMRVRRFIDDELTPFHAAFIAAGEEMGLPRADLLETLDIRPSVCAEPSNSPDGVRWNTAFAYLDAVRPDERLRVLAHTIVDHVLLDGGRAVGVRAIGPDGPLDVLGDTVVLAAGTYGSPSILLRTGIGPAADLRALGGDAVIDLPGVGGNLHDHPAFELFLTPTETYRTQTAAFAATGRPLPDEQGFASAASSWASDGVVDLHVFSEISLDGRPGIFVACLTPSSRGRLRLTSLDPEAPPVLDHAYLTDPGGHDLGVLRDGVRLARRMLATGPLADLVTEADPGPDVDLDAAIRAGVIHYWHPVGTCAMGDVTDARGRVRGLEGLFVADASLMPRTVRATTNLPTVVIGDTIASFLVSAAG
ncbi:MAG TPA: GMC family oxidoreductase [Actinomycetota bacterium]|nr:GMC family oxidoreductase [Actinomycetota bacterium]